MKDKEILKALQRKYDKELNAHAEEILRIRGVILAALDSGDREYLTIEYKKEAHRAVATYLAVNQLNPHWWGERSSTPTVDIDLLPYKLKGFDFGGIHA